MAEPLRVLLVERPDRGIAPQLLANYDQDFGWVAAASPQELIALAAEFGPHVVLCGEYAPGGSARALLDALRLLCVDTPAVLIASVHEENVGHRRTPEVFLENLSTAPDSATVFRPAPAPGGQPAPDETQLRSCFAALLDASNRPVIMTDADGWITFANTSACRSLERGSDWLLGSLLAERRRRLAYFDPASGSHIPIHIASIIAQARSAATGSPAAVALAISSLRSARICDEASAVSLAGDDAGAACGETLAEIPSFGSVVRITPNDYLIALPRACSVAEAAFTAQRVLESMDASDELEASGHGAGIDEPDAVLELDAPHESTVVIAARRHTARPSLERDLADVLGRRALSIAYQPQYEIESGRGCGMEALARWVLTSGGLVSPARFIAAAERSGLIRELGAWVLRSACEAAAVWCTRSAPLCTLSVNVSALQIDANFCATLETTLRHSGFPAERLELEITESALIGNTLYTIDCLHEWKRLGVRIAVDDFGTGYSSLSYLPRLPIDRLKLDRSLIHMMTSNEKSAAVLRSIIALGAELDVDVMAEGVETEQQFQMLAELGCPRAQGFLLARPMTAKQAQVVLRKSWGNRPRPSYSVAPRSMVESEAPHVH